MAAVNFLWHLHQPDYRRPDGGGAVLPWVRLHAAKGYSDLAEALARVPEAHCTVNFSGILLEQLEHFAAGNLDYYAELSLVEPAELEPYEREFMVRNFFSAQRANMINVHPRYRELFRRREALLARMSPGEAGQELTEQELRDLAVWFNLAWIGFANARRPEISRLIARGRGFDKNDMRLVLDTQLDIARGVLGRYRELAAGGAIELSITPHHHPILPLVLDLEGMAAPDPGHPLPPFGCAECARWQVRVGIEAYRRAFDAEPAGAWPAEGSVSDAALHVLAEHGLGWAATDQQNLPRGLGNLGHLQPCKWKSKEGELVLFFRDTRLADNIGFEYSRWNAETAARHFVKMCSELASDSGLDRPVITVALDGENPWEYYHDGGSRFLACLFTEIAESADLECRLPRELASEDGLPELEHVSPGSWIGGNFDVWSRHPETRRAWSVLAEAHAELAHRGNQGADRRLLAAQASDYFWWYGDDFSSNEKAMFDELFRGHLQQAYTAAGQTAPVELSEPIGLLGAGAQVSLVPAIAPPVIDGKLTSYYEWHGALRALGADAGAMARQGTSGIREMRLAISGRELYLRLDLDQPVLAQIGQSGAVLRLSLSLPDSERNIEFQLPAGAKPLAGQGVAVDRIAELVVSLGEAGLRRGEPAGLELSLVLGDMTTHRFPASNSFRFIVPASSPALDSWLV